MCSHTQVVIVTHRGPVIPCQRHMFCSNQVIFLFFLFSFIQPWIFVLIVHLCRALMLESPVATRKTSVNPLSSTLIGLQLFAIHLATVLVNLPHADLVRGLHCSVRVVWCILLELPSPTNACFALRWYFRLVLLQWNDYVFLQSVHITLVLLNVPSLFFLNTNFPLQRRAGD